MKEGCVRNRIVLCDRRKEGETSEFSHNGVRGEIVGIILLPEEPAHGADRDKTLPICILVRLSNCKASTA